MPKKRMPHGRSVPRKNVRPRTFTPSPVEQPQHQGSVNGASTATSPSPGPSAPPIPRSALRSYTPRAGRAGGAGAGLVTDYVSVLSDLRHIAIIAGAIFVILIVLAFIIK